MHMHVCACTLLYAAGKRFCISHMHNKAPLEPPSIPTQLLPIFIDTLRDLVELQHGCVTVPCPMGFYRRACGQVEHWSTLGRTEQAHVSAESEHMCSWSCTFSLYGGNKLESIYIAHGVQRKLAKHVTGSMLPWRFTVLSKAHIHFPSPLAPCSTHIHHTHTLPRFPHARPAFRAAASG